VSTETKEKIMSENMMPPEGDFEDEVYQYIWVNLKETPIGPGLPTNVEDRIGDWVLTVHPK